MELLRRIAYLWNRRKMEREMAEEMAYHRELMQADAAANFGSDLRLREDAREVWGWAWLDGCRQDLAYACRVLRNSYGFTLTAMLILALGIGVPLTAFRVVLHDLRGGSTPDPATLVRLTRRGPGFFITNLPYPQMLFYSENAKSYRSVVGVLERVPAVFGDASSRAGEQIHATFVTPNYFTEFGIAPQLGRVFTANDERLDTGLSAMVSEAFWQQRLGGDPKVVGQTIRVNGKTLRVVGVGPRSARPGDEVWIPLARQPSVVDGSTLLTNWNSALDAYARLKPGISAKASEQETLALAARLREIEPTQVRAGEYLGARPMLDFDDNSSEFRIVLTAAALVLLLLMAACANLGTLILARGVKREREIKTRLALGAGRMRIVRQLFTESLLLAVLSGACALLFSTAALKIIQLRHNPDASILPDWQAFAGAFGVALLAALVFGLPPALRLTSLLPRAGRVRSIFLAAQVAVSCLLLVVSSLLLSGLQRLQNADPGFDYRNLVWISSGLKDHGYGQAAAQAYQDLLRARVAELPKVTAVSEVWLAPWGGVHMGDAWQGRQFSGNHVDGRFLATMGMRLLRGRNLLAGEVGVALISESAERVLWPDGNGLGKRLPWDAHGPIVVGVVQNASTADVGVSNPLEFYLPFEPGDAPESVLLVRVSSQPHDLMRHLQDAARVLDPRLQPTMQLVAAAYDRELQNVSRALVAVSILGTIAILLSAIGLAGMSGFMLAQRTREIGLRIALGACAGQVVRAVLAPMIVPVSFGFACGALGGFAVGKILRSGVSAMSGLSLFNPLPYLLAIAFFIGVAGLSILAPTRRAIQIDPVKALHHE